jgi:hypothetical protein
MQFPETLPHLRRRADTSFAVRDQMQKDTTSRGTDIERALTGGGLIDWSLGHGAYTEAQALDLINFYFTARGQWFDMVSPLGGAISQFRFKSVPSGKSLGAGKWSVAVEMVERK